MVKNAALALMLLLLCSWGPPQDEPRRPAVPQPANPVRLRLLDETGQPVEQGSSVRASFEWVPSGIGSSAFPRLLTVGADGRTEFVPRFDPAGFRHGSVYIHVQASASDQRTHAPDRDGLRRRALVSWPIPNSQDEPAELRLEPERLLGGGALVDEKGRALRTYEARVTVRGGHEDMLFLGPRVEQMVGSYALYGWPCDGAWTVSGRYGVHGPTSEPRPLKLGSDDLDVVMPETGTVQVQVRLPRPFPHGCLEAAYRHVESGEVVRWPVMDDTTNHRLRVGRYVAAIELPGEVLLDLPPIELGHEQQDVPLALPDSLRVFRITVEDELGNPIPAAAGLIAGTAEHAYHNDAIVGGMLVATARPSVDLTITSHGYVPVRLLGIDGDRRVVLDREE